MSSLNDIIKEIRTDYEGKFLTHGRVIHTSDKLSNIERRIENLEKIVLFFLDKEGPKENG